MLFKNRLINQKLSTQHAQKRGRLLALTGARQTGKTTLVKQVFPQYTYLSMEDPMVRTDFNRLSAQDWVARYPQAIVDEVQKLPSLFEVLKAAYDQNSKVRYLLLGSSQILLLKKVRETLAGRIFLQELFPLTLPELLTQSWEEPIANSRFLQWIFLSQAQDILNLFQAELSTQASFAKASQAWETYLQQGGMPAVWDPKFNAEDRLSWIEDYQSTYLQRDLSDLAQLDHLEPFVRCQKALAMKTGQTINYSELARLSEVTAPTARRFLRYLELSYQVVLLPAYHRNLEKRLSKMPKVHFVDPGICRGILKRRGAIEGAEFESAVVSEVYKQAKTLRCPVEFYHLRTLDGREVDLLIETENGFHAIECKKTSRVAGKDFRHLKGLQDFLDKPLLSAVVVSQEKQVKLWQKDPPFLSLPAAWMFS